MTRLFFAASSDRFNIDSALKFGDPVYLFKADRPSATDAQQIYNELHQELELYQFNPEEDFIVLTGQVVFVSLLVGVVLGEYGGAKLLIFDAPGKSYAESSVAATEDGIEAT